MGGGALFSFPFDRGRDVGPQGGAPVARGQTQTQALQAPLS